MDYSNLYMELGDRLYMRTEVFMKVSSKMKIKMDMEDKYSKMENIISANLKMIKEKDQVPLYLKVAVFNKVIGKTINFQDEYKLLLFVNKKILFDI